MRWIWRNGFFFSFCPFVFFSSFLSDLKVWFVCLFALISSYISFIKITQKLRTFLRLFCFIVVFVFVLVQLTREDFTEKPTWLTESYASSDVCLNKNQWKRLNYWTSLTTQFIICPLVLSKCFSASEFWSFFMKERQPRLTSRCVSEISHNIKWCPKILHLLSGIVSNNMVSLIFFKSKFMSD